MPQQIDEDPHSRSAITDAAHRILQRGDQRMHRNQLVPTLMLECCRHLAPDIGLQRVTHALHVAVQHRAIACTADGWYTSANLQRTAMSPSSRVSSMSTPATHRTARHSVEEGDRRTVGTPGRSTQRAVATPPAAHNAVAREVRTAHTAHRPPSRPPSPSIAAVPRVDANQTLAAQVVAAAVRRIRLAPRQSVDEHVLMSAIAKQCFPTWSERRAHDEVVRQLQGATQAGVLVRQQGSYVLGPQATLLARR